MAKGPARSTIPTFRSGAEERRFWEIHDTSPFVDWRKARVAVFPALKPSAATISLRLPAALSVAELKALTNRRNVTSAVSAPLARGARDAAVPARATSRVSRRRPRARPRAG
jgi:hypothetical protein